MKLSDFYRQTVDMNDYQTGGWSKYYYGVFSEIIRQNDYKIIAEVGIGYGTHAKYILKENPAIHQLYLIDPMKYYLNDQFAEDIVSKDSIESNAFDELFQLINKELELWKSKIVWYRKESLAILPEDIADDSIDCIFIDGDHSYVAVLADLRFWWKKLRVGGQILGDDYWMDDVKQAVSDFSKEKNITFDFLTRTDNDYKIFRFHKSL
jgi:SAM-dependent methyltransferase